MPRSTAPSIPSQTAQVNGQLQTDGKIVLTGAFTTLQPNGAASPTLRQRIARVNADGTLDITFDVRTNGQGHREIATGWQAAAGRRIHHPQPNSAAIPTAREHFARVATDPGGQYLTATSAARVLWSRSGAAPEVSRAAFDLSTDGGNDLDLPGQCLAWPARQSGNSMA